MGPAVCEPCYLWALLLGALLSVGPAVYRPCCLGALLSMSPAVYESC